jgi:MFS family permease
MFSWYREISAVERRTFWGCFGGWALDALDVQLFGLVIPALIATFGISRTEAGLIGGITLFSSAFGGWLGGALSDRFGRVKALQVTILWFSVATFCCAFVQSFNQLLFFKALQGVGFGAEWATGAVLMAEIIRPEHRGKALGSVQSAWAVGWGAAVILSVLSSLWFPVEQGWRVLFAIGVLPALLIIYVRRSIPEPEAFLKAKANPSASARTPLLGIFAPDVIRMTAIGGLLGVGAHGGFYALNTFLPAYLSTERKLSVLGTGSYLAVIIVAFWCGCIVSAYLQDRIGRRQNILFFAMSCVATVIAYLFLPLTNTQILVLGFPLGFFSAGIPASMGALFNELYPGGVRGTGVGFCYNFGRVIAASFPPLVGYLSETIGYGSAIGIVAAVAYSIVVIAVLMLPETKGKSFTVPEFSSALNGPEKLGRAQGSAV